MKHAIAAPFRLIAILMIVAGAALLFVVWYVEDKTEKLPTIKIRSLISWKDPVSDARGLEEGTSTVMIEAK